MTRRAAVWALCFVGIGCAARPVPVAKSTNADPFFAAKSMHVSPVFTKVADFDGDNQPDGIEAVVELQDRFGDPTKAVGRILFQIYRFAPYNPDPRGDRIAGPFEGRLDSVADQKARYSRVNRAYIFQLAFPMAALDKDYVLEASFETDDGRRLFDRLMIEGDHTKPGAATGPAPLGGPTTRADGASTMPSTSPTTARPGGAVTTQEYRSAATTSQPHEPPPRADQP